MKAVVVALAGALVVCLVVIAFLVGRVTAPAVAVQAPGVPRDAVERPARAEVPRDDNEGANSSFDRSAGSDRSASLGSDRSASPGSDRSANAGERAANTIPNPDPPSAIARGDVGAYFDRMKRFQVLAGGDPNAYANELLEGATKGDVSGFDNLLAGIDKAALEAKAITPPERCADYHATLLALLSESRDLVRGMREAIANKNLDGLTSLAARAQSMQSRVEALEAMEQSIRNR